MTECTAFPETADIETSSADYATRFAGSVGEWMLSLQAKITLQMLEDMGVKTILDVGGGHGQLAFPLVERGYDVTVLGSDETCSQRLTSLLDKGKLTFQTGNVIELPFDDGSFDAVISFRLLPHCTHWRELLGEMTRVAKGPVLGDYPTTQSVNAIAPLLFGAKKKMEGNTRTWRAFAHKEIADVLKEQHYKIEKQVGQFFWPMVLHRMLKKPTLSRALEAPACWLGLSHCLGSPIIFKAMPAIG